MDTRCAARSNRESKIPISREQKATTSDLAGEVKLAEIVCSLFFLQNSGHKFQTHISNSGEQIPKHARQNSEGGRFPVSHYKARSRGHRFLGTDSSILVSEFKFPARPRIWEASHSHFSIFNANLRTPTAWRSHNSSFRFRGSQLWFQKGPLGVVHAYGAETLKM